MTQREILYVRENTRERLRALSEENRALLGHEIQAEMDPDGIFVRCDAFCLAQDDPPADVQNELALAYVHWRHHQWTAGCSHGR